MSDTDIPDVDDTDLTRDEMEEAAEELDVDTEGLDDQELLERLGVALGEIDESQVSDSDSDSDSSDAARDGSSGGGLRATLAGKLQGAAAKLRPSEAGQGGGDGAAAGGGAADAQDGGEDGEGADEGDGGDPTEQELPGEPIEGPTRDELRDQLRELDLPVTGTKDELQARLDEARADQAETGGGDGGDDPTEQELPGEPIEGPTRDELRDQLRELDLPVTGTKDELQARLDEARGGEGGGGDGGSDDPDASRMDKLRRKVARKLDPSTDGDDADGGDASGEADEGAEAGGGSDEGGSRLRDRFADRLDGVADRIRASGDGGGDAGGEDEHGGSGGPAKLKLLGAAVKRKVTRRG